MGAKPTGDSFEPEFSEEKLVRREQQTRNFSADTHDRVNNMQTAEADPLGPKPPDHVNFQPGGSARIVRYIMPITRE